MIYSGYSTWDLSKSSKDECSNDTGFYTVGNNFWFNTCRFVNGEAIGSTSTKDSFAVLRD